MRTLCFLLVLPCLAWPALASASTAKLDYAKGSVEIGKQGSFQSAKTGAPLETGDSVRTGENSLAVVLFTDGSRLKLNASSTITLSADDGDHRDVSLLAGGVYARIKKRAQASDKTLFFKLHAKAVTMGVRGTEFFSSFGKADQKDTDTDLWMCVEEGVVTIGLDGKPETPVKAGQGVYVRALSEVTPPKAYAWTKTLNWKMEPHQGDLVDHSKIEENYRDLLRQNYD